MLHCRSLKSSIASKQPSKKMNYIIKPVKTGNPPGTESAD